MQFYERLPFILLTSNVDWIVHRHPSHSKLLSITVVENMEYFENR